MAQSPSAASCLLLSPRALSSTLSSATSPASGLHTALLMTREGSLVAYSGGAHNDTVAELAQSEARRASVVSNDPSVTLNAGLMASLWKTHVSAATNAAAGGLGKLNYVLTSNEHGYMGIAPSHTYLVCVLGNTNAHLGMLKMKVVQLAKVLEKPLTEVTPLTW